MVNEISVVIPAYNEAENIDEVVKQIFNTLEHLFPKYELIVVDDGSNDGTYEIVNKLSSSFHNLKCIRFEDNRGYGAALREGFREAAFRYVFYTDSDGQFDIREIEKIMPIMDNCDMVAGFRLTREDNLFRRLSSAIYNQFVSFYLGIYFMDVNCSFKLFKREILDRVRLESNGFSIDAELLWKTKKAGYRICERGVRHYKRDKGRSKVRLGDTINTIKEIYRVKKL